MYTEMDLQCELNAGFPYALLNTKHQPSLCTLYKQSTNQEETDAVKPALGLLINTLYDEYGQAIREGIKKACDENGYNLICFVGGSLNSPYFDNAARNSIYQLATGKTLAGMFLISSSIGSYLSRQELHDFCRSFHPLPIMSIGVSLENIPSVTIDNSIGMRDLMKHLLEIHGCRRIAIICGPAVNSDARVRLETYKAMLAEFKLPVDPELIVQGSFHSYAGEAAVCELMDKRKIRFDALIGANDHTAINAMQELERRGIRGEIAVAGYDNIPESQFSGYALTTVDQPAFDLGYRAARILLTGINGNPALCKLTMASQLVVRNSCGCRITYNAQANRQDTLKLPSGCRDAKTCIMALSLMLKTQFQEAFRLVTLYEWAEQLYLILNDELTNKVEGRFIGVLQNLIKETETEFPDNSVWETILTFLFNAILSEHNLSITIRTDRMINLLQQALGLIHTISLRNLKTYMVKSNEYERHLSSVKKMLDTVTDVTQIKNVICKEFPLLGIRSCFLSVYEKNLSSGTGEYARLIIGYRDHKILDTTGAPVVFRAADLVPGGFKQPFRKGPCFLMALEYRRELLGFILYEIEERMAMPSVIKLTNIRSIYEMLTTELSTALKNTLLFPVLKKQRQPVEQG